MGNKSKCNGETQQTKWQRNVGRGSRFIALNPRWAGLRAPSLTTYAMRLNVDRSLVGIEGPRVRHFVEVLPGRRVR